MSQIVRAHIVNVTKIGNDVGLIYSVTMAGRPVPAVTAANDLRLMTVNEVIAELGHPILTKAEREYPKHRKANEVKFVFLINLVVQLL